MTRRPDLLIEHRGAAGLVTLNRPDALNALTLGMIRALDRQLDLWAADDRVTRVVVRGAGERAFCAGGDLRALYELGRARRFDEALGFWREEYRLNARIKVYPKPYIALIQGIDMGGGVGVSVHGSHRVAAERIAFAMPEVGIGLFPDVGATWFMPRLPGRTGTWLALTGSRLGTADALRLGVATHHVPAALFDGLVAALAEGEEVNATLDRFAADPGKAPVEADLPMIDRLFGGDSVEAILAALDSDGGAFARDAAAAIRQKSPTSLKIALEQMRVGAAVRDFREAMRIEHRIVSRVARGPDLYEGIRAAVVDKDAAPRWSPSRIEDVDPEDVARYFAPLGDEELTFQ